MLNNESNNNSLDSDDSFHDDEMRQNINDYISQDLRNYYKEPTPKYSEVCPPTYQESIYYPNVKIKIATNYDIEEEDEENISDLHKRNQTFDESVINIINKTQLVKLSENTTSNVKLNYMQFNSMTYQFCENLIKINRLIEEVRMKLENLKSAKNIKIDPKKSKEVKKAKQDQADLSEDLNTKIQILFPHKIEEFTNDNHFELEDLNDLKSILGVDMFNTKDVMSKYFRFLNK